MSSTDVWVFFFCAAVTYIVRWAENTVWHFFVTSKKKILFNHQDFDRFVGHHRRVYLHDVSPLRSPWSGAIRDRGPPVAGDVRAVALRWCWVVNLSLGDLVATGAGNELPLSSPSTAAPSSFPTIGTTQLWAPLPWPCTLCLAAPRSTSDVKWAPLGPPLPWWYRSSSCVINERFRNVCAFVYAVASGGTTNSRPSRWYTRQSQPITTEASMVAFSPHYKQNIVQLWLQALRLTSCTSGPFRVIISSKLPA